MKRCFRLILLPVMLSFILASCEYTDEMIVYPSDNEETLASYNSIADLIANPVEIGSIKSESSIKLYTDEKWTIKSEADWLNVSPSDGYKNTILKLSYLTNSSNEEREASLTLTMADGGTEELKVIQAGAATSLTISEERVDFTMGGGATDIDIKSNSQEWSAKVTYEGTESDWCSIAFDSKLQENVSESEGVYTVTKLSDASFSLSANSYQSQEAAVRRATLVIEVGDKAYTMGIKQSSVFLPAEITLNSYDAFAISWDDINADSYSVEVAKDDEFLDVIYTKELAKGTTSYDLSVANSSNNYDGYVGVVYARLKSTITLVGAAVDSESAYSSQVSAHNLFDSGEGSEVSPYIISAPRHILNIGTISTQGKYFRQIADVDLSGVEFTPIATFSGVYDAGYGSIDDATYATTMKQYKISNITYNNIETDGFGLFQSMSSAKVRNLIIENTNVVAFSNVASITGTMSGESEIAGCYLTGSGTLATYNTVASTQAGGFVAKMTGGVIFDCHNNSSIAIKNNGLKGAKLGGIVGFVATAATSKCDIISCTNSDEIYGQTSDGQVGGIAGEFDSAGTANWDNVSSIKYCSNSGRIGTSQGNSQSGGIVGKIAAGSVEIIECWNRGEINGNGSSAGITARVGTVHLLIKDCYNSGTVKSANASANSHNGNAAGVICTLLNSDDDATRVQLNLVHCMNVGEITQTATWADISTGLFEFVADVESKPNGVGLAYGQGCYALDAENSEHVEDNSFRYNTLTLSTDSDCQATFSAATYGFEDCTSSSTITFKNLAASAMSTKESFEGWDFTNVWEMTAAGYPTLRRVAK